ncbi:hypothetical protein D3C79_696930 [compost metagenome]
MGTRRGKRADVEQQVQRLFNTQWMVVRQGMRLAPLPAGRVFAKGFAQVLEGLLPGDAHDGGAVGTLVGAARVPPR